jgi:formylglycine-generating enzyme required for sulfatase activity
MGDNEGMTDEQPAHNVRINHEFYLSIHEVTNAKWRLIMGDDRANVSTDSQLPVEAVSWEDAVVFCKRLSEKPREFAAGRVYRLPTEAEWEYACRAGTSTRYSFGDDETSTGEFCWFAANAQSHTHPVGSRKANAWGLYDMHGNAWEWCSDGYKPYASENSAALDGGTRELPHVIRGGSCRTNSWYCRSSFRFRLERRFRAPSVGFRVAMSLTQKSSRETKVGD